ncbi:hypothetical protein [Pseudarthrobacter oxydans]|uniref:hypothetical protein n=1 Tax=Pseudarthrobacter oxydans TaxID=1671 RepID=UPI00382EA7F6
MADKTVTSRGGNVVSVLVNAAMMWGINIWPGWRVVPFLTRDTDRVLGIINASLTAGIVANLVFVVIRNRGIMALGNLVVLGIGHGGGNRSLVQVAGRLRRAGPPVVSRRRGNAAWGCTALRAEARVRCARTVPAY